MKSRAVHLIIFVCLGIVAGGSAPVLSGSAQKSLATVPTAADFFRARAFQEPLVPIGGQPTAAENIALAKAISIYSKRTQRDDMSAMSGFLQEFPRSPWRASILTNLGLEYRQTGWFLKAMTAWKETWELSKNDTSVLGKPVADRAIGELAALNTRLGRRAEVEAILAQIKGHPLIGPATELVTTAREAVWMMRHDPGNAQKCGPFALALVRGAETCNHAPDARILTARSTDRGTSLDQVWDLSKVLGMEYQMARRSPGSSVPVPSLINWKAGHYAAVIQERNGLFLIQDPTFGQDIWVSKAALDSEASGYFLIRSTAALPKGWHKVDVTEAKTVWGAGYAYSHDAGTKLIDDKVKPDCQTPMAHYNFHTQEVSLNIMDTPVGYTPPAGPDMHFTVTYNQRESSSSANRPLPNLGPKWVCNWVAYIDDVVSSEPSLATVYLPGGGVELYDFFRGQTTALQSGANLVLDPVTPSYERRLPDGSRQIFDISNTNPFPGRRFFMTALVDPAGQRAHFNYNPLTFRLMTVTDALDQTFTVSYASDIEGDPDYYLITRVEDFAHRTATFEYDGNKRLWKIHDAIGITSEFLYNQSGEYNQDFITSMTTPYGTTTFSQPVSIPIEYEGARTLQAVEPDLGIERLEYQQGSATLIEATDPNLPSDLPGGPSGNIVENGHFEYRNSFYWNKKAMAMYPPNENGVPNFSKAKITHWLHVVGYEFNISNVKEREKWPLENPIYYRYAGQIGAHGAIYTGTQGAPSIVARRLDNGTGVPITQVTRYERNNPFQKITKMTDPKGRVTSYKYAENNIDLIGVFQRNVPDGLDTDPDGFAADKIFGCTYYPDPLSHLPHVLADAAGETTTYTYTPSTNQLQTVTNADGLTVYEYGDDTNADEPSGYLIKITSPAVNGESRITRFKYDGRHDVKEIITLPDDYSITIAHDALQRPTLITYPDTTTEEFGYDDIDRGVTLDLTSSKDRLGRVTARHYNRNRQMDSITEPSETANPSDARTTTYHWCACGNLDSVKDANLHDTKFERDLQGRVYRKIFDDQKTINYLFEGQVGPNGVGTTSRLASSTDALNQATNYLYDDDDNLKQVSYTNAHNPTATVDYTYDNKYNRIETVVIPGGEEISYTYHPVATLGAGKLKTIGSTTSNTVAYTYDPLGRIMSRSINDVDETVVYDALGRLRTTVNVLSEGQSPFVRDYEGVTSRLQDLYYPGDQLSHYTYFGNTNDRRLSNIQNHYRTSPFNLSEFDYTYLPDGQIASWSKLLDTTASALWFTYDKVQALVSARNALDPNAATQQMDYVYDKVGNRTSDRNYNPNHLPSHGITNSYGINTVNQVETLTVTSAGATLGAQAFVYDAVGNLTDDGGGKTFEWDAAYRLVAINYIATGNRTEFAYDGLGRRVKITEYQPNVTAEAEPSDGNYANFSIGKFTMPAGTYTVTLQGLNPNGGNNTMLIDSVKLNNSLISNGSFENPAGVSNYVLAPTGATWTFSGSAGVAANGGAFTSANPNTTDGNQVGFIGNHGLLSQTLYLSAGTYTLTFKAAQLGSDNDSSQRILVTFRSSSSANIAKSFVWCGNTICEERDGTGANVTKRFFAEGEQRIVEGHPANYFYTRDHLGSIREVTKAEDGSMVAQYDYDPYGKRVTVTGEMDLDFGYAGYYYHAPSGLNLTQYRAYNPALGRWLSRDPIGEAGGLNLYGYVGNNPIRVLDPLGLVYRIGDDIYTDLGHQLTGGSHVLRKGEEQTCFSRTFSHDDPTIQIELEDLEKIQFDEYAAVSVATQEGDVVIWTANGTATGSPSHASYVTTPGMVAETHMIHFRIEFERGDKPLNQGAVILYIGGREPGGTPGLPVMVYRPK